MVALVFDHYRRFHPRAHPRPRPESLEYRRVLERLMEGLTVEQLCEAIDGCHRLPHNQGVNDTGAKFLGLDLIMRSGSHVARYMEVKATPAPMTRATSTTALALAARQERRQQQALPEGPRQRLLGE